jgi:hypothetical protein
MPAITRSLDHTTDFRSRLGDFVTKIGCRKKYKRQAQAVKLPYPVIDAARLSFPVYGTQFVVALGRKPRWKQGITTALQLSITHKSQSMADSNTRYPKHTNRNGSHV